MLCVLEEINSLWVKSKSLSDFVTAETDRRLNQAAKYSFTEHHNDLLKRQKESRSVQLIHDTQMSDLHYADVLKTMYTPWTRSISPHN